MQTHDSNRGGAPGSKPRHPVARGSSHLRPHVPPVDPAEDALASPAPPTDDTPTIISRNGPSATPPPSEPADPGIRGRLLAHFELLEAVGVGGMAAVIRARDTQLDRFVALKILPPEMASDEENVRRFHQEARSAAKLDHENVARVFFCGEDQRLHFIAFEFVEGDNLRTLLERRGRLGVAEALNYVTQVAAGLAHASARGVVHRDVKPSNIIVTPAGRAKLVDMGLARSMERTDNPELTQSGVTLGTFDYISPEQALEPRDADVRSDVYSLGCTFYHLLTGRTPTPEGTAAKKLHHHQHVAPVDPRHYVPDLPFDVVQILDRMMAKKPGDRYQTPEELVARLLQAAQALGVHPGVPEGALAVEAAAPAPLGRPLVWAALAAVAIIALVFVLDPLSGPAPVTDAPAVPKPGDGGKPPAPKDVPEVAKDSEKRPPVGPKDLPKTQTYTWTAQSTLDGLAKWLREKRDAERVELLLAADLTLPPPALDDAPALSIEAKQQVVVKPAPGATRPTVRLRYGVVENKRLVALEVNAPQAKVEGVRFVLDTTGADVGMIGLRLRGGKNEVTRCEFVQARASLPGRETTVASLLVAGGEAAVRECAFLGFDRWDDVENEGGLAGVEKGGQHALVLTGPARLDLTGCAFGPHAAAVRLEGDGGKESERAKVVVMRQCTVLLPPGRSSAFEFAAEATGPTRLDVAHCLFSRLDLPHGSDEGAVLVRQAEYRDAVRYEGHDNVYHDLDGFWANKAGWRPAGWGAFRNVTQVRDTSSRLVHASPWAVGPKEALEALEGQKFAVALRLSPRVAALRKAELGGVVGTQTVLGERLPVPDEDKSATPARRVLVVEKDALTDDANGVYPDLASAVRKAKPGDVIQVRHDGELETKPVALTDKASSDVTVRPARRFRPRLALDRETTGDSEAAFFRVQDGTLRLEGMEFRIAPPSKTGFKLVSLVSFIGDGQCFVSDCVATLEAPGKDTPAALASLTRPDKDVMKGNMTPARKKEQGPLLVVENTLVRGEGDLFWTAMSRPCQVDVKNSVVALTGSLASLAVPGGADAPEAAQKVALNLTQATTYLGGNLVRLAVAGDPRGVVPVECKAGKSLFVASGREALVNLRGEDGDEKSVRDRFRWVREADAPNGYGGYSASLLSLTPPNDGAMVVPVDMAKWKNDYAGDEVKEGVSFPKAADPRLSQTTAATFARPTGVDFADLGADVAKVGRRAGQ